MNSLPCAASLTLRVTMPSPTLKLKLDKALGWGVGENSRFYNKLNLDGSLVVRSSLKNNCFELRIHAY